jgi:hypothetical protein
MNCSRIGAPNTIRIYFKIETTTAQQPSGFNSCFENDDQPTAVTIIAGLDETVIFGRDQRFVKSRGMLENPTHWNRSDSFVSINDHKVGSFSDIYVEHKTSFSCSGFFSIAASI